MSINFAKALERGTENGVEWATLNAPLWGAVNGYVKLPDGHPWRDIEDIQFSSDINVHGGVTYGMDANGWIGFDTLHSGDSWPENPYNFAVPGHEIHWTPEMVAAEARRFARLAAEAQEQDS